MGLTRIRAEQISDIDYKQAVRVITLTDINLSGGAPAEVDGVSLTASNRILVAGQDVGAENGLYVVQTVGAGSNGTWIRSSDGNQDGEIEAGMIVMVTEGTVNKDTQWKLITNDPIVIGTTPLVFEQNSAFAFGNIFANGTAVLANTVGDTVTFTAGDNIAITGNASAKSVTIAVTGISLNSISNGTSNVSVVSSGGNVTVGVAGTEVAELSTNGLAVTGNITGNGAGLTGINVFSNISIDGGNSILADSISDTLTLVAGTGIVLLGNSISDTITIATAGSGDSIFSTGGQMGLITEAVIASEDLGLVTAAVLESYSLGTLAVDGIVTNQNIVDGSLTGNKFAPDTDFATTGNLTVGNLSVTGAIGFDTVSANGLSGPTGNILITGNLIPTANATYALGSATNVWKDLYLANSTIFLGEASISASGANLVLPSTVQLGEVTLTSEGNTLSLPENISATTVTVTGNISAANISTTGLISATGNITTGGTLTATSIVESSSLVFKENIRPMQDPLESLLQLSGVIYDRKDGSRKNEPGLLAEKVYEVLPDLVSLDDHGRPVGVQYSKLTVYLVESIKLLKKEIDDLRKKS
jgi:hypothetical protein